MDTEDFMSAETGILACVWASAVPTFDGDEFESPDTTPSSLASYIGKMRKALTVQEVASLLAMSSRTVQQWAKVGRLPAIRHGSLTRFDPIQLANWIRENNTSSRLRTN